MQSSLARRGRAELVIEAWAASVTAAKTMAVCYGCWLDGWSGSSGRV